MAKFFGILCYLFSFAAVAHSSATLHISGYIPPKCSVRVRPEPKAFNLNLRGGERRSRIAIVNEMANTVNGYNVQISSLNGGVLVNTEVDDGSEVPYQISYDGAGFRQPGHSLSVIKTVSALDEPISHNSNVLVHIAPQPQLPAGTYQDTLTIQISSP